MGSPAPLALLAAMLTPILARVKILTKTFDCQHLAMLSPKIGNVDLAMENGFVPNLLLKVIFILLNSLMKHDLEFGNENGYGNLYLKSSNMFSIDTMICSLIL